jgi:hypothetical protein
MKKAQQICILIAQWMKTNDTVKVDGYFWLWNKVEYAVMDACSASIRCHNSRVKLRFSLLLPSAYRMQHCSVTLHLKCGFSFDDKDCALNKVEIANCTTVCMASDGSSIVPGYQERPKTLWWHTSKQVSMTFS